MHKDWIAILDFGSQYTHLIARRVRECGVYSEIVGYNIDADKLLKRAPKAIIFSGGPASVTSRKNPMCDRDIFNINIPVLGICYGAQLMAKALGGRVVKANAREYGKVTLQVKSRENLFRGLSSKETIWMSHGDKILRLPRDFRIIGSTENSPITAMENKVRRFYGLQFHPEVVHTPKGKNILKNFLFHLADCRPSWSMHSFVKGSIKELKEKIGNKKVLCALSGGVDSSVLAALLHKAIGKNLIAIFIDNGLLRKDEVALVKRRFKNHYRINLKVVNAQDTFLKGLKGVKNPETKRKIIGRSFIEVFEREAKKLGKIKFLAQGTLYPDVIESRSPGGGPSATIKTHHNVGGLPRHLKLELIEPLKNLFKDEVRLVGKELELPDDIIYRQPFPGPGLAVRIIGAITKERLDILRQADWILIDEIKRAKLYRKLWQSFCVLLPVKTVGVMGDQRSYENLLAVRAVTSEDAMTAHWARLPYEILERISNRIINEVKGINRVVYDISSKPPSTIEWE
ncbi:MAG TPA: glutamine-hydrolyzing GMP synthase [bacterium]|nr:glutamine-hydrolyzing GMP synthase [bacterium]